jgi:hypothetical protein
MSNRASQRAHARRMIRLDRRYGRIVLGSSALILAGLSVFAACKPRAAPTEQDRRQVEAEQKAESRRRADGVAGNIIFLREARTGLCFAYLWESYGSSEWAYGGPALATVDCDKVANVLANGPAPTPETPPAPAP